MKALDGALWPGSRLGEAMLALARASGLAPQAMELANPLEALADDDEQLSEWLMRAAHHLELEIEPAQVSYGQLDAFLRQPGPAIVRLPDQAQPGFLALLGGQRVIRAVAPSGTVCSLRPEVVHAALCNALEAPYQEGMEAVLHAAGVAPRRQTRARAALLRSALAATSISGCWQLRLPISAPVKTLAWQARLPHRLLTLLGAHTVQYALWLLSWWLIGRAALQGRLDGGWLLTWALLLFTLIPFRVLAAWWQGLVAVGIGGLVKQRLLRGALNLEPDDLGHQGMGQLFGRVLEADTMEALALSGGFVGLVALVELVFATAILGLGAGGWPHAGLLLGWMGAVGLLGWRYVYRRRQWSTHRLTMTQDLLERMIAHRTRLAQEPRATWHTAEDQAVAGYATQSRPMDRLMTIMLGGMPRGWLALGMLGLLPVFVAGQTPAAALAVSLGGLLLAYRALEKVSTSLVHLADAGIAWKRIAPLFHAAARTERAGVPAMLGRPQTVPQGDTILEGHDLVLRYDDRAEAVLRGCSIRIQAGDRLLLQGPSGGGKSALAALLTGLRRPTSGLLLLRGLDRATLGPDAWRRQVVAAPQFHDNHVLSGTLAFNLLMGRRWPPTPQDLQEAKRLCHDLGLGELLARMPGGLLQMVGETGWQLSHGEQSRLFMARALLQRAEVVVLDESFAALDPANLQRALRCVQERAATLLVIAHP